ncbi:Rapid ALkalinization Factor [Actinobacteria bacterium OK074]|nr:Rapid ALkalinization Factor [Actinobacteria bacterium OK074]
MLNPAVKNRLAAMVIAAAVAMVATLFGPLSTAQAQTYPCPGGPSSGASSSGQGTCPSLHNRNIVAERAFPSVVYRGDSRPPIADNRQGIFDAGMWSRGTNSDIRSHVQGDRSLNSEYISTSGSQGLAESFARSQGANTLANLALNSRCSTGRMAAYAILPGIGQYLLYQCLQGVVTARTYVYLIDPVWASNAMYIPDQIRGDTDLYNHYHSQDEWAYVRHIPNYAITGVRIYTMTAQYHNGFIRPQTISFRYDQFVANPRHVAARVQYDPATDRSADWNYNTELDSPSANAYTRGCSSITMCRNGS